MTMEFSLTKEAARKRMVAYHLRQASLESVVDRLRSVQFDPLCPVGCNHDLVLQARVSKYKIGDWMTATYRDRRLYDGWDKQACLVPFEGWPLRRVFHEWHRKSFDRIFLNHSQAIDLVLRELEQRGPLMPKEFKFQEHRSEWKGTWFGPSLTKQTLRALWYTGQVMTHGRKGSNHVYDLTDRLVPPSLRSSQQMSTEEAVQHLVLERHKAVGLLRPNAQWEVWSLPIKAAERHSAIEHWIQRGELLPVVVDGVRAHATPEFLSEALACNPKPTVTFIGPLDQLIWDRKFIAHIFEFDYLWEVYVPETKRQWGYYVLPVLYGDTFVARAEFWARKGILEIRQWHWHVGIPKSRNFWTELEKAMIRFKGYSNTNEMLAQSHICPKLQEAIVSR